MEKNNPSSALAGGLLGGTVAASLLFTVGLNVYILARGDA
jgi:hypothetical protein